jgi:2-succinyl-5-enolpyruvyl-6-hydroxy-3-cyclohexene-1-carboxylate synthase
MMYSNIPLAHTLVSLCKACGISQVVISPGSRNAPLTLAFTADPFFKCFSIVDERSAAFFALGLSQQSPAPSVLVCTSGSALLNYHPAVAEGFYSRIPLVILSADRPEYKIDIGDGQTIRQNGVFENHIGYQVALAQDVIHAREAIRWVGEDLPKTTEALQAVQLRRQAFNEKAIGEALNIALKQRLPVHLNAPFEEPLYGMQVAEPVMPSPVKQGDPGYQPSDLNPLRTMWEKTDRKMIIIGALAPGSIENEILARISLDPSILVFTETTSNIHHPHFLPSIDSILAPIEKTENPDEVFQRLRPGLLLTLGGMIVSKKIKQFLRGYPPKAHWHIDPFTAPDTFYCLKGHIKSEANAFLKVFLPTVPPGVHSFKAPWLERMKTIENQRKLYLKKIPFSDFQAFDQILNRIPPGVHIHLANSSAVRYAQLFEMSAENPVFCNRGTSGIEGSTSTAVGASINSEKPTLLLSGDLSFFYDINGLWNNYLRADFRIIVINNGGGGIFRILPGKTESANFETFFETVQDRSIKALCKAYGIGYEIADTAQRLAISLGEFYKPSQGPKLLEVKTPRKQNDSVLLDYFDFLSWPRPNNH